MNGKGRPEGKSTMLERWPGRKIDDDWWLELYVMLSRATRLEDLLLIRAPAFDFVRRGPPAGLKRQLLKFAARTEACRRVAERLTIELGFAELFH